MAHYSSLLEATIDQISWTSLRVTGGAIAHVHMLKRMQQDVSRLIPFTKSKALAFRAIEAQHHKA